MSRNSETQKKWEGGRPPFRGMGPDVPHPDYIGS